jgi:nicotinamide riboside kinase
VKNTTVINLLGGPGSGKSTLAAEVFAVMKHRLVSCEMVREYVKEWAWRGRVPGKYDQPYLYAKQLQAESALYGKVDYIITDCPLFTSVVYEELYSDCRAIRQMWEYHRLEQRSEGIRHVDLFVQRQKTYVSEGRYQTEAEAKAIDLLFKGAGSPVVGWTDVLREAGVQE